MKTLTLTSQDQDTLQIILAFYANDLAQGRFEGRKDLAHITMDALMDLGEKIGHDIIDQLRDAKSEAEVEAILNADRAKRGS